MMGEEERAMAAVRGAQEKIRASERYLDKIRGCLFGGAVGDALGYPVEFLSEKEIFPGLEKVGSCSMCWMKRAGRHRSPMTPR